MVDDNVERWTTAVAAFNAGDPNGFYDLIDDGCTWAGIPGTKPAIVAALAEARANGWVRHDVLSAAAAGPFVVTTARNTLADGSTSYVGGVARFGDGGRVIALASLDEIS